MIDINFLRENKELVIQNIKNKFQEDKIELVDKAINLDDKRREYIKLGDSLRQRKNEIADEIGRKYATKDLNGVEDLKTESKEISQKLIEIEEEEKQNSIEFKTVMLTIPNIMHESVPIGKDDNENVEIERYLEAKVPSFEVPYHVDILEKVGGIDLDSAREVAGSGFYYLDGDIARLHSAILSYARDFMINRGFEYTIPPYMMRGNVVQGVMSFKEMDEMMYKINDEDLYLIGTSEHTMIGRYINKILPESTMPIKKTSYSPCFRKEKGSHGIEERGIYRVHQFEKQEMIIVCKPEESWDLYEELWKNTVDLFVSMEIPVRKLEICSGDLADLKAKSCDIEAWSPRQQKYFEVGSCSNLTDAQARRLQIRIKGENGTYLAHTLNNTVVAPPRMLIAFVENHLREDGSIYIPEPLRMYMGNKEVILPKN